MQNIQNNRLAEIIKENEKTIIEFTKELQSGFSQKTITIDVIETVMIKTLAVLKKSMIVAAMDVKEVVFTLSCWYFYLIYAGRSSISIVYIFWVIRKKCAPFAHIYLT